MIKVELYRTQVCFEFERVTLPWPHRDPFLPDGEAEAADRQDDVPEERRAADGVDQSVVYEEPLDGFGAWQKTQLLHNTYDHKTSHKGQFISIEIYTWSESWINMLSIDVWFVMIGQYLKIWNLREQKNLNIEKFIFKLSF